MEQRQTDIERLDHAFSTAKDHLGIEKLLDPEGKKKLKSMEKELGPDMLLEKVTNKTEGG